MKVIVNSSFVIDRISGFPILVPVKKGIIQEFYDREYNGKLSEAVAGKHVSELITLCKNKLYKTWVKNYDLGNVMMQTGLRNKEYALHVAQKELDMANKTISYNSTSLQKMWSERIVELKKEIAEAKAIVDRKKEEIFQEHGIKF